MTKVLVLATFAESIELAPAGCGSDKSGNAALYNDAAPL
jgi:hypothetical protein